jgi:hypothetical protein
VEKRSPKLWATSAVFTKTTQSKQSPNKIKFAQSGHLGPWSPWSLVTLSAILVDSVLFSFSFSSDGFLLISLDFFGGKKPENNNL